MIHLAVNGTLMRGLELNGNLLAAGAEFVREDQTEAAYRLFSIGDRHPGMFRVGSGGASVAVEIWAVPPAGLGAILQAEPPGLCVGKVRLAGGRKSSASSPSRFSVRISVRSRSSAAGVSTSPPFEKAESQTQQM